MKRVHGTPLPTKFLARPVSAGRPMAEHDIAVHGPTGRAGRLRVKLLVFRTQRCMRKFARTALGHDPGGRALGWVINLAKRIECYRRGELVAEYLEVDPRYACLICLVHGHLTMEIVTHEACHAAHFFADRSTTRWPHQDVCDDEAICYPTGRIAKAINAFLYDEGLYGDTLPAKYRR